MVVFMFLVVFKVMLALVLGQGGVVLINIEERGYTPFAYAREWWSTGR